MRKLILISCFALSVLSFAAETKLPENVEKKDSLCCFNYFWC